MAGAKLLYRDENGGEAAVEIGAEGVFLGRGTDCAVRTDDAMVSRKNCRISLQAGRWLAEDLGSSNGTYVNGVRIQKQALAHADVVRCGTLQVRFVERSLPPAAVAPPEGTLQKDPALSAEAERPPDRSDRRERIAELERVNADLQRENRSLKSQVESHMRISDGLRLEKELLREQGATGRARVGELSTELERARTALGELRARMENEKGDGARTAPMPVATEGRPLVRAATLPFPIPAPVIDTSLGGPTIPEMPTVSPIEVATALVDHALAELRASLLVARSLVAEPGVVVPSTARAVVVALENAARRADEAQEKLGALRDAAG